MEQAGTAIESNDEHLAVLRWRADQLARLGLSRLVALSFAHSVDWHDVAALVERGCTPDVALRIAR